jgi:molybdate transport system permease protein
MLTAVLLSLRVALLCVAISLPFGLLFGWLLARGRFRGKMVLDVLFHLPLVLPPVVTGYLLLLLFGARGIFGPALDAVGIRLVFHWTGAALASAVVGFPLMLRAIRQAIESVDPRLEAAARTLGAGRFASFRQVTLPLAWPGIVAGAVLAFARSVGEFGATITFVGNIEGETRTIPLAISSWLERPGGEGPAMTLALVSVLLSFAALAASEYLTRRSR